jgi:stress response protein YsnF
MQVGDMMTQQNTDHMELFRITDLQPEYRHSFEEGDIIHFEVRTAQGERVGKVADILMDDIGQLYYLVVAIGSWLHRRLVLVTPEQFRIDRQTQRIYLIDLTKYQIEHLPPYHPALRSNRAIAKLSKRSRDLISRVKEEAIIAPLEASAALESSAPLEGSPIVPVQPTGTRPVAPKSPKTVALETVRLLEERLVAHRQRRKVGEVIVRKAIETKMIQVPLRREVLIVEQINPEHKQLAVVDLTELNGTELNGLDSLENSALLDRQVDISRQRITSNAQAADGDPAFYAIQNPSLDSRDRSVDLDTAHTLLTVMAQKGSDRHSRVHIQFEDPQVQAEYKALLGRISASA